MTKKTTAEERREYIEQQREDRTRYGHGPNRRVFGDASFIDREGNIIRPDKKEETSIILQKEIRKINF